MKKYEKSADISALLHDDIVKLEQTIAEEKQEFEKLLSPTAKELYEKIKKDEIRLSLLNECSSFSYGIKFGESTSKIQ